MEALFEFLRVNAGWLFGGSSVLSILVSIFKNYQKKQSEDASSNGNATLTAKHRQVIFGNTVHINPKTLNSTQAGLIGMTCLFGILLIFSWSSGENSACEGTTSNSSITAGESSTNIIAGDCANVSTN